MALGVGVAGLTPGWVLLSGWLLPDSLPTAAAAALPLHPSPVVIVVFGASVFIALLLESVRVDRRYAHQHPSAGPTPIS